MDNISSYVFEKAVIKQSRNALKPLEGFLSRTHIFMPAYADAQITYAFLCTIRHVTD